MNNEVDGVANHSASDSCSGARTTSGVAGPARSSSATGMEDQYRADAYSILAALLGGPPTQDLIDYLQHIQTDTAEGVGECGRAWQALGARALAVQRREDLAALDAEYHRLFIGLGRGEVVPFGSWHLTGFLMEKPLSELRDDLRALGIAASEDVKDPEDHIAALFETMAVLIGAGDIDEPRIRRFFVRHIDPWALKFFKELHSAASADFYQPVADIGSAMIEVERQYLNIQTH